jgi:DNA topoisomerase-1
VAGFGRFGPYIQHDGKYASLSGPEEVFTVGINRAVTLLAEKAARGGGRRRSNVIKDLGEHPQLGGKVEILTGKFGPYAKHGKVNATLPKDRDPAETTLEEAVELIAAKSGKGGAKKAAKKPAKKAAKPAAAKTKTATKAKTAGKSKKADKVEPVEETVS